MRVGLKQYGVGRTVAGRKAHPLYLSSYAKPCAGSNRPNVNVVGEGREMGSLNPCPQDSQHTKVGKLLLKARVLTWVRK